MPTLNNQNWDAKVKFLTNFTLDNVLENNRLLPRLGLAQAKGGYPLTELEQTFIQEDAFQLKGVDTPHDCHPGSTVIFDKKKFAAPCIEFHYRNDSTRHMWGTPATFETDMPLPNKVLPIAEKCAELAQAKLEAIGGEAFLMKEGYIETDDRYALWLLVPFSWIMTSCRDWPQYKNWLQGLCQ